MFKLSPKSSANRSPKTLPKPPSLWKTMGPSFVLLGLALGSGELILWPYLAANYGMGLLWGGVLGISFQYILNTEVMRYSLAWGESVFVGFRKLSRWIPLWYIFSTFIPWSLPGFSSATAQILTRFLPFIPEEVAAVFLLISVGVILSLGKTLYTTIERVQKFVIFVSLPFIFILTLVLVGQQEWLETARGLIGIGDGWLFFPQGIAITAFLGAFAYSGAGGNLNLAQSYYIKEKGFGMGKYSAKITSLFSGKSEKISLRGNLFRDDGRNQKLWKKWWRLITTEHFLIFWLLGLITIIMMAVLAKTLVFGQEVAQGLDFLYLEADAIAARTHDIIGVFFLLIAALLLYSTHLGILESSSRIISENVFLFFQKGKFGKFKGGKKANLSKGFYVALWLQIALGMVIYSVGWQEPRFLLTVSAVLNGAAMMVAFPLVYLLNKKFLNKKYQPGLLRKLGMLAAFSFFAVFLGALVVGWG